MSVFLDLMNQNSRFDGEYSDQLSNHLPMALFALYRLGATDKELGQFFDKYTTRLEPRRPSGENVATDNWQERLGLHSDHDAYFHFFVTQIAAHGHENVLRTFLPKLISGLAGGAFHGLIRTAYGLDGNNTNEIAEGLAHWSVAYLPISASLPGDSRTSQGPVTVLKRISSDSYWSSVKLVGSNIFVRMAQASKFDAFKQLLGPLPSADANLPTLSRIALEIFMSTRDFTALHLVTSSHALRLLLPYLEDKEAALNYYWMAFMAAYIEIGRPAFSAPVPALQVADWANLRKRAIASMNDHIIKLVYTCTQEEVAYSEPLYKQAAELCVRDGLT